MSRPSTCSSPTTTWSSGERPISASCSRRSRPRRSTSSPAAGWTTTRGQAFAAGSGTGRERWTSTIACSPPVRCGPGQLDGLPVYDTVHSFLMAGVERLGPDPWNERLKVQEHTEFSLSLKERGLLHRPPGRRRLPPPGVPGAVRRQPRSPPGVLRPLARAARPRCAGRRSASMYTRTDKLVYGLPSTALWWLRRAGRVGRRVVRERRVRAS